MKTYVFKIMKSGKSWEDEVRASDKFTAEGVMKTRYPGAVIDFRKAK